MSKVHTIKNKKPVIDTSRWSEKKHACARLFAVAWTVPEDKIEQYAGMTSSALKTWEEGGLIEKVITKGASFYVPTEYGEQHFNQSTGHRCYKTGKDCWEHNYALLDVHQSLDESEQESWRTEADLKKYARDMGWDTDTFSITDGAYIDSETGEIRCVEIETKHYKDEHIAMKHVFVSHMGGYYEPTRI